MSKLDWTNLCTFLATGRHGSTRAAAEELGIHYSSVARQIAALEAQLGTRLFDRSVTGYLLTDPGTRLVRRVEAMETEALAISREITGADTQISGELRVSMSSTIAAYLLVDDLRDFCAAYPSISLRIDTGHGFADVTRRDADVVVRVSDAPGDLLVGRRIGTFHESVYATKAYLGTHSPDNETNDCIWLSWLPNEVFRKRRAFWDLPYVEKHMQIEDEVLLLEAVKSGWGIGTLPCFYGDTSDKLVRIRPERTRPVMGIWLLTHPDIKMNARVRAFTDFFAKALARNSDLLEGAGRKGF